MAPVVRQVGPVPGPGGRRRGRRTALVVLLVLVLLALLELVVLIRVGELIGALPTVLLVVVTTMLGLWLLRREGTRTWRALGTEVQAGRTPSRQLADGVLVLVGGLLLLLPGLVGDVVGLVLVLPFTRPIARPLLEARIARRVFLDLGTVRASTSGGGRGPEGPGGTGRPGEGGRGARGRDGGGEVVEGEIVDDD